MEQYCNTSLDITILQLQEKLPAQTTVTNLNETIDLLIYFRALDLGKL
jgi:hypothetical protein